MGTRGDWGNLGVLGIEGECIGLAVDATACADERPVQEVA